MDLYKYEREIESIYNNMSKYKFFSKVRINSDVYYAHTLLLPKDLKDCPIPEFLKYYREYDTYLFLGHNPNIKDSIPILVGIVRNERDDETVIIFPNIMSRPNGKYSFTYKDIMMTIKKIPSSPNISIIGNYSGDIADFLDNRGNILRLDEVQFPEYLHCSFVNMRYDVVVANKATNVIGPEPRCFAGFRNIYIEDSVRLDKKKEYLQTLSSKFGVVKLYEASKLETNMFDSAISKMKGDLQSNTSFPESRYRHCYAVGLKMYNHAYNVLHWNKSKCIEMFTLGNIHDIGYEFDSTSEGHCGILAASLKDSFKYYNELFHHSKLTTDYQSEELNLLYWADATVDGNGNYCTYNDRIEDLSKRYSSDSEIVKDQIDIVNYLKSIGYPGY